MCVFSCTFSFFSSSRSPHTLQGPDDKKLVNRVQDNRCLSPQTHTGVRLFNARESRGLGQQNLKLLLCSVVPHATTVTTANCLFSKSSTTLCYVPVSLGFFSAPFRFDNFSLKHRSTESEFCLGCSAHADYTELLNAHSSAQLELAVSIVHHCTTNTM